MTLFAFDTETYLIAPGVQAPPLVCGQWCIDDSTPELVHVRDPAMRRTIVQALETPGVVLSGHNVAFDMVAIMAQWPDLSPLVIDAYNADKVVCTIVRQKLLDIASGEFKIASKRGYDLGTVGRLYGVEVNKDDPWRLRYGELYDVPVAQWPADAKAYALADATAQRAVHRGQSDSLDQFRQSRAALWLKLMSTWGIAVDRERAEQYIATVQETLDEDRKVCQALGLVRPDGSKDTKAAMRRMVRICQETGERPPLTASGEKAVEYHSGFDRWWALAEKDPKLVEGISLSEDSVIIYGDEALESYQRYATATNQIARAERLYLAARAGKPIQARFGECQDSGRISCSQGDDKKNSSFPSAHGAQLHNPAKDKEVKRKDGSTYLRKGTREIFIARPGHAFVTTDWEGAEASAVAQVCIWTPGVGFSRMAEVINAGGNLPTEFGALVAGISREEAYALRKAGGERKKNFDKGPRQSAKIALYGYFADMGPAKLALQARKQYRTEMTEAQAAGLKEKLKIFAPELPLFWSWGRRQLDTLVLNSKGEPRLDKFGRPMKVCKAFTQYKSQRVRGMLSYTELLNTPFQGLVSDMLKIAGVRMTDECYTGRYWDRRPGVSPMFGCRTVNSPHDDYLVETPLDRLHEAGHRQAEIMSETTREWCPDVAFRVEPAACVRWYKDAEPVFDITGRLIPWEPKAK